MASAWRERRQLRAVPAPQLPGLIEYLAVAGLCLIGGALVWAAVAPTGNPERRPGGIMAEAPSPSVFSEFDPFFRLNGGDGRSVVTSLNLTLHGVRADRASGRGSAIIGLPDGTQNSYAVGDPIIDGAVLAGVGFDSVTIRRDGALEKLYLDQSDDMPAASLPPAPAAAPGPAVADPFAAVRAHGSLMTDMIVNPRQAGGRIDGYVLQPSARGDAFRASGLKPGDVLVGVNGTRIANGAGMQQFFQAVQEAGSARVDIERDGRPMSLIIGGGR